DHMNRQNEEQDEKQRLREIEYLDLLRQKQKMDDDDNNKHAVGAMDAIVQNMEQEEDPEEALRLRAIQEEEERRRKEIENELLIRGQLHKLDRLFNIDRYISFRSLVDTLSHDNGVIKRII
ncbi:MAG: hypothetical protein EZS28_033267, partial [Streblomastix strix]